MVVITRFQHYRLSVLVTAVYIDVWGGRSDRSAGLRAEAWPHRLDQLAIALRHSLYAICSRSPVVIVAGAVLTLIPD